MGLYIIVPHADPDAEITLNGFTLQGHYSVQVLTMKTEDKAMVVN